VYLLVYYNCTAHRTTISRHQEIKPDNTTDSNIDIDKTSLNLVALSTPPSFPAISSPHASHAMSDPTPTPSATALTETPVVETPPTAPTVPTSVPTGPTSLTITVLVQSGARHNFLLDTAYLDRHAVKAVTEPLDMTVTQLKECIWKDWRDG
jgi:hypothetical protein